MRRRVSYRDHDTLSQTIALAAGMRAKLTENRDKYATIATVQILGKVAYLRGMRNDPKQGLLSKGDFEEQAGLLRARYGVEVIHAERRSKPRQYDTGPAPLS